MKTLLAALIAVSTTASFAQNKPLATTFTVNPETTKVEWTGKKVAGPHMGTIKAKSGTITVQGEEITSGKIVMDMNTITVTDLEGEWKDKLEGHLKHSDFFDVAQYPRPPWLLRIPRKRPKAWRSKVT